MNEVACRWVDGAFRPITPLETERAAAAFKDAGMVFLKVERERDMRMHRKHFAVIRTAFDNLPEDLAGMAYAASAETLRKHALIACGYADCETVVMRSMRAARQVGAYLGKIASKAEGYSVVDIERNVVRCWTPHSQSLRAMGARTFEESRRACAAWCADLLGVSVQELEAMGKERSDEAA